MAGAVDDVCSLEEFCINCNKITTFNTLKVDMKNNLLAHVIIRVTHSFTLSCGRHFRHFRILDRVATENKNKSWTDNHTNTGNRHQVLP